MTGHKKTVLEKNQDLLKKQEAYLKRQKEKRQDLLKEHNSKLSNMSRRMAEETYPRPEKALTYSKLGLGIGYLLLGAGLLLAIYQPLKGLGTALVGGLTVFSNRQQMKKTIRYLKRD
ncbi:hypothetical protein C4K46_03885 [Streptococcus oricebi]|uniref:Uncharacterized protein n=2 Tax=Streptococcus oricebi TaxID=1547447 RepID=A0ABS5B324_9STRE|nr:hypothetical protein [Streptococcus oricebi]